MSPLSCIMQVADALKKKETAMPLDEWMAFVDSIEKKILEGGCELQSFETEHHFTQGLYIREFRAPAGAIIVSNIHNTEHPFTILNGIVTVRTHEGTETFHAPHYGITRPYTRRILHVVEDVRWLTYHPTTLTSVTEIQESILLHRDNPLLDSAEFCRIRDVIGRTNLQLQ